MSRHTQGCGHARNFVMKCNLLFIVSPPFRSLEVGRACWRLLRHLLPGREDALRQASKHLCFCSSTKTYVTLKKRACAVSLNGSTAPAGRTIGQQFQFTSCRAASAASARSCINPKNAADCPMKSPSAVRLAKAPIAAPSVAVGRMMEHAGSSLLMNAVGSGIIRLV